ncbi:transposase [Sulfitobacter sp. 915]|uniref:transposase n=1 Tax=Sulfitobacter sp. 915 TaxID=3368558 RepID=UPI0037476160
MFAAIDEDLKGLLDRQIAGLEAQIEDIIAADASLAMTADILRSVPGIGPVVSTMLIAEMPELGQISGEQAAALTGLAPIAHDSGAMRGKRTIGGGRRLLRHVMFQAALVASHHNRQRPLQIKPEMGRSSKLKIQLLGFARETPFPIPQRALL